MVWQHIIAMKYILSFLWFILLSPAYLAYFATITKIYFT
jgi:hypothetical protein